MHAGYCNIFVNCELQCCTTQRLPRSSSFTLAFHCREKDVAATWGMERNLHLGHFEAGGSDCQVSVLQHAHEGEIDSNPNRTESFGGKLSLIVFKRGCRLKRSRPKAKRETSVWKSLTSFHFSGFVWPYRLDGDSRPKLVWSLQEQRIRKPN